MPVAFSDELDQDPWAAPPQIPPTGVSPPAPNIPTGPETIAAAFRQNNWIVNVGRSMFEQTYPPEPGYEPVDDITGTKYDKHISRFLSSRSRAETHARMAQMDEEERDKETMAASGWSGTLASVGAGIADPLALLIPGGEAVMAARGALAVGATAKTLAKAGAIATAIPEAIMYSTQQLREPQEVALNIASGTILSAIIGVPAAAALTRGERAALTSALDRTRADIAKQTAGQAGAARVDQAASHPAAHAAAGDPLPVTTETRATTKPHEIPAAPGATPPAEPPQLPGAEAGEAVGHAHVPTENVHATTRDAAGAAAHARETLHPQTEVAGVPGSAASPLPAQQALPDVPPGAIPTAPEPPLPQATPYELAPSMGGGATSAGAAAADTRRLELLRGPGGIPLPFERTSPTRRMFGSPSVEFRRITADLLESVYRFSDNLRGVATSQGPSADRAVKQLLMTMRAASSEDIEDAFAAYRKINQGRLARTRTQISDYFGGPPAETLTWEKFKEELTKALAYGDRHASIPEIDALAKKIRQNYLEPLRARAEAAIPGFKSHEGIEGESYLPHDWDKEVIKARRPEFQSKVAEKITGDQEHNRAVQQRLDWYNGQLGSWSEQIKKYNRRLETVGKQQEATTARMAERQMELARGEKRTGTLEERSRDLREEIEGTRAFINQARQDIRDPALNDRIDELEGRLNELTRADRPMTEPQMSALEQEELRTILSGPTRKAAEMLVGRRNFPKVPSFIDWLAENGGVRDVGGDVASIVDKPPPGLINKQKGRELADVAQQMRETFPSLRNADIEDRQILDWIADASSGRQPAFMIENVPDKMREDIEAARLASMLEETFSRAGIEVNKIADVAKVFRDERISTNAVTLEDLDQVAAEMEAAGQAIPVRLRRMATSEALAATQADVAQTRKMIADAIRFRDARIDRLRLAEARGEEAGIAEKASYGRLGVLNERLTLAEARQAILEDALLIANKAHDEVRGKIEKELGEWHGTSTAEAASAIKAREKYASQRAAQQAEVEGPQLPSAREGKRLETADGAVDRAVNHILAVNTERSAEEIDNEAMQLVDRIIGGPDGRLDYDFDSGGPAIGPPRLGSQPRGSAAHRRFDVSNAWAMDFLKKDTENVLGNYFRTLVPDIVLAEKFGDPEMPMAFHVLNESYDRLRKELDARTDVDAAAKEKLQTDLRKRQERDIADLADNRDLIRGVYGWSSDRVMQNLGTMAQHAKKVANIVSMGSAAMSSIPDFSGVIATWGLNGAMEGWGVALKTISSKNFGAGLLKDELQEMGIALDVVLNRQRGMEDMADVYSSQSKTSRVLSSVNDLTFMVNGLNYLTDFQKIIAGTAAHGGYRRAIERLVNGTASAEETTKLLSASIDHQMAQRIYTQFYGDPARNMPAHSTVVDGIRLGNIKDWTDRQAASAFQAAVARDADIAVLTPGHEVPLMMSHPMLSAVTQFKRIIMAAHERILVANMQRADANALVSMSTMLLLGAASWRITMALQGRNEEANKASPGDIIREALNRSNVAGWFGEAHETVSKSTGGALNVFRPISTKEPTRFASRNTLETLLGPTAGRISNLSQIAGAIGRGDWAASDTRAVRNAGVPWQNLFYTRGLMDKAEEGFNQFFGVPKQHERR
jgi:hypothetical protein